MDRRIPIGIEFYKKMIEGKYYYVDKTLLIKEVLEEGTSVSLFTRPRRFGKTLAMTMLQTFFEDERDRFGEKIDNSHYFAGKKIAACEEICEAHMGKYPVISLSLKSAKQPTFEMAYNVLVSNIREEYRRHWYVCENGVLFTDEKEMYQSIMIGKAQPNAYATSLEFLSKCLEKYHGRGAVILIDEYDVPLENSYFEGFYDQMIKFIRSLFESSLKTNKSLAFAVVTGCLRISRESIFTGLNNLKVISVLSNDCAEYFGFTPGEVGQFLKDYGMECREEEVKRWYDGYLFGETEVYNPWSVINYVGENRKKKEFFPKPYWSNTSSNSIVKELIETADFMTRGEIEELMDGGVIEKPIHEDITYDDIHESQDNLWNFLFFTGYLKKVRERFEGRTIYLTMTIPNEEIAYIYENTIASWFDKKIKGADISPLINAMEQGDCKTMEVFLSGQLLDTISYFDYAENYYHGFLSGLLKASGRYLVKSNRESGEGRADLFVYSPTVRGKAFILELKVAKEYGQMEERCDEALKQASEKNYRDEFVRNGYQDITVFGISFYRKECIVKQKGPNLT
ncbi:MAG: ATP-binding protein [Roseburia sp.]|nr:ATP-binding protein [Roseburia sp.]